jgi:hypothetical protein
MAEVVVNEVQSKGSDVDRIISKIDSVLDGEQKKDVLIACLAIAFFLQHPNIKPDVLLEGINQTGEFIVNYLRLHEQELPSELVN